jgi:hypothetical protein
MPQNTIFECKYVSQNDKNMTRVKNEVINVKVVLTIYVMTLTILPEILFSLLYFITDRISISDFID